MRKYIQIKEAVLSDISSGKLKKGDKLPVREELIKKYNVTRATLNKALSELIKEGRLEACRNRGTFIADPPEKLKIALVSNFHIEDSPMKDFQFFHRVEALKYIMISSAREKMDFLDSCEMGKNIDLLSSYDLVVWLMPNDEAMKKLKAYSHKVIIVNRYDNDLNFVSTNHRLAVKQITERFIEKCGEDANLIYLDTEQEDFITRERREGFVEACEERGKFYRFSRCDSNFDKKVKSLMKLKLSSDKANVIISPSQSFTGAVLRMGYLRDLRIGKDFFYSDFDNADSLERTGIEIPSILQDYKQMGIEAIVAAKESVNGPVRKFIPFRLVNI